MPPLQVSIGHLSLTVTAAPLTPSSFSPYGDVIQNPRPSLLPPVTQPTFSSLPFHPVSANQGSAIKYRKVSRTRDLYYQAPSRVPSELAINLFVCRARPVMAGPEPRTLFMDEEDDGHDDHHDHHDHDHDHRGGRPNSPPLLLSDGPEDPAADPGRRGARSSNLGYIPVTVLERHPYTTQTFTPVTPFARFLVIVAPSLPHPSYPGLPAPPKAPGFPGPGLPDLERLQAFVGKSGQSITYAAGTWHAPMVVLGARDDKVDFVVTQFENGVPKEDCQEVELQSEDAEAGILVEVGGDGGGGGRGTGRRPVSGRAML